MNTFINILNFETNIEELINILCVQEFRPEDYINPDTTISYLITYKMINGKLCREEYDSRESRDSRLQELREIYQ